MSPDESHALLGAAPALVPLAWNFVVPAFLGFLVGSTYVLAFGLAAAVVVWIGSTVLFALWLATGLYPFNRLALIGYAVGGVLVLRAVGELTLRAVRRLAGRVRLGDLTERDRDWAGGEAVALGRLARAGARVAPGFVDRRVPGTISRGRRRSRAEALTLSTRHPQGGPVSLARLTWNGGEHAVDLDRIGARAIGRDSDRAAVEVPLAACFTLLDQAEWGRVGAARLTCAVTAEGVLEVTGCEPMARAEWLEVWVAGAGVDLAADPVSPLEQELTEAAWGWDQLLLGRRSPDDVRFLAHRPYVSFEASRGGARSVAAERRVPDRLGIGVLLRDLLAVRRRTAAPPPSALRGPRDAVDRIRRVCGDGLAPMHGWSTLALRSVRWIGAVVTEPDRRDELLERIQAPEALAFASIAEGLDALRTAFGDLDPGAFGSWDEVATRLGAVPNGARRRAALDSFLARHGHRGPGERTLAGARLSDRPSVLAVVGGLVASGRRPARRAAARERPSGSVLARLDPFEWWVRTIATVGAFAVGRRVAARERAIRALAALRASLLSCGEELVTSGVLAVRDDVFWLTLPDWRAAIEGGADVRPSVERRRRSFEADAAKAAPAVVAERSTLDLRAASRPEILRGIAASSGVARGRVIAGVGALPALDARLDPTILVLDDANPAFAAGLGSVAAVVCERGGLLSHLAIVARELRVPAVMGVANAAQLVSPGAWIEVDGGRGEVRVLGAAEVAAAINPPDGVSPQRGPEAPRGRGPRS